MVMGVDWCHPTHAMRTKCACGEVVNLSGAVGDRHVVCECGRHHSKRPGSGFEPGFKVGSAGQVSTGERRGGRKGCPGLRMD